MFLFEGIGISALIYSQNELCLSSIHFVIKASRIHSERIQILLSPNVSISPYESLETYGDKKLIYLNRAQSIQHLRSFVIIIGWKSLFTKTIIYYDLLL